MGRKKNDGYGKFGGRQKGTPNSDKPLKTFLRAHSEAYFTPCIPETDEQGNPTGNIVSQFDIDIKALDPVARADTEIKLLKYHTPAMQATSVDMTVAESNQTLSQRLALLAAGEDIPPPE